MDAKLPKLGVGLGFRRPLMGQIFFHRPQIDFLEIITDHYLDATRERDAELELLAAHFPLVPHGINLSLGSADGVDPEYVRQLAAVVRRIDPAWWSEHICFTRAGGVDIGHLSPMPFTREALEVVCRNVQAVQSVIDVPLILENIAYVVALPGADMTEAQFISEVVEQCDCGLLLDVTNLYTNATNHGYDPHAFLRQLPLERVVQLHFAGGHWVDDILVDSHSQATHPEAMDLMADVLAQVPVPGAVLERDENLPPLVDLLEELEHARAIGRRYGQWT